MAATLPPRRRATFLSKSSHSPSLPSSLLHTSRDDVRELISLISTLRGFPSDDNKDIYGLDTKLDFATFEIQWSNQEDDPAKIGDVGGEQKDEFKRVVDSVQALARQFAKQDSAV